MDHGKTNLRSLKTADFKAKMVIDSQSEGPLPGQHANGGRRNNLQGVIEPLV